MTSRAAAAIELIRTALVAADQLDPAERDAVYGALVDGLRSRRPEAVSPLRLGPPSRGSR